MNITAYSLGLPRVDNIEELSYKINLSEHTLHKVLKTVDLQYKTIHIPKKSGFTRTVHSPSMVLKAIQAWILRNILDPILVDPAATAFVKNTNIKDNVKRHNGNRFFLCMDIEDFFHSIGQNKVYQFFKGLGYNSHMSLVFSKFCTYDDYLPQGAVTSPSLSNLINIKLDRRIFGYCSSKNIVYSRYADDFTFSCNNPHKLIKAKYMLEKIIEDEGYELNENKTRILRPGNARKITGLIVAEDGKIGIGRKKKRLIRANIYNLYNKDLPDDEYKKLENHIQGWFNYLYSVDQVAYHQLKNYQSEVKLNSIFAF
ncbi:RNA-dependent DNA polymerase [Bacillus cereus]|uniref:retron St85 family RNA-directed DNA polymerase n=1 Tax=Bacillus cereus TaxID=1396 RepID=UPI000BEBF084|nr:retron St85 family RNA-directed DNA polymerase [Bacillus cereus]PDY03423.1 RNA-dependent DNA polymerase [Bacillus cereus]